MTFNNKMYKEHKFVEKDQSYKTNSVNRSDKRRKIEIKC